jgi:hypothetical protein
MSTFTGLTGSWYLVRQGTVGVEPDAVDTTADAAGNELLVPA